MENVLKREILMNKFYKEYIRVYAITNSVKLRSFQFNTLNQTLVLNEYVFQRKRCNTKFCTFCDAHDETLMHFFWECILVQSYWKEVRQIIPQICWVRNEELVFNARNIVFNRVH